MRLPSGLGLDLRAGHLGRHDLDCALDHLERPDVADRERVGVPAIGDSEIDVVAEGTASCRSGVPGECFQALTALLKFGQSDS